MATTSDGARAESREQQQPPVRTTSLNQPKGAGGGGSRGGQQQQQQQHSLGIPKENHSTGRRQRAEQSNQPKPTSSSSTSGNTHSSSLSGGRRPVKVWNAARTVRKAFVVSTYDEFHRKGREKLGLGKVEPVRVVLEADGTQVDDGEYFLTLSENSVFLFLRAGEIWRPAGTDAVKAVMEAIPSVVCDTLYSMGLHDQVPSWKITDSRGRITVVLQWEKEPGSVALAALAHSSSAGNLPSRQSSLGSTIASGGPPRLLGVHTRSISQRSGSSVSSTPCLSRDNSRASAAGSTTAIQHHSMLVQTSFDSNIPGGSFGPHITVINHDSVGGAGGSGVGGGAGLLGPPGPRQGIITGAPSPRQLSRQGSSVESATIVPIHHHTAECSGLGRSLHQPMQQSKRGSPTSNECDFHCCSLHSHGSQAHGSQPPPVPPHAPSSAAAAAAGGSHKTVATSPIQPDSATSQRPIHHKGAHVRFSEVEGGAGKSSSSSGIQGSSGPDSMPAPTSVTATMNTTTATLTTTANGLVTTTSTTSIECHAIMEPTLRRGGNGVPPRVQPSDPGAAAAAAANESSESETENNDDLESARKFLLLVDQLSSDQQHHLSIKDIGIILERLSAKIVDVERLERELEGPDTRNWTIKATIRGEGMRELGVIYNSNYYSISEHPGYQSSVEEEMEEEEEEDDDEADRTTEDTEKSQVQ